MSNQHATTISAWMPEKNPVRLAVLGKLIEEAGELSARAARCVIQGLDERDPATGRTNLEELAREMADVLACLETAEAELGASVLTERVRAKFDGFKKWHGVIETAGGDDVTPEQPARRLIHGQYAPGDRVRYTGRGSSQLEADLVGKVGTVVCLEPGMVGGKFGVAHGFYLPAERLEHERLPQFLTGDRVRVKAQGLFNVREAAGSDAVIIRKGEADTLVLRFSQPVTSNDRRQLHDAAARPHEIELVTPDESTGGAHA